MIARQSDYHPRTAGLIRTVRLTPELLRLAIETERDGTLSTVNVEYLVRQPESYAHLDGGLLVGASGVTLLHHGRALGWMLVTRLAGRRHLAAMTRFGAAVFDRLQRDPAWRRIEIDVRADRPWRESFAARLGMTEALGPARARDPQGNDYWLYARVAP